MATLRTLRALVCPTCGLPVPAGAPGTGVTCTHCGTDVTLPQAGPAWSEQVDVEDAEPARSSMVPMVAGCAVVVVVLGALVCCGVGVVGFTGVALFPARSNQPQRLAQPTHTPAPTPTVVSPPASARGGLQPSDISSMGQERWNNLGVEPPYPYQNFDAVAALPWARELAKKWMPDARFVRSDINGVRIDGSLDLMDAKNSAGYRFYSPSRAALAEQISAVSEETPLSGFRIWVNEGMIRVIITDIKAPTSRGWQPLAKDTTTCTSASLMKAHMAHPKTKRAPTYDLGLRWRSTKHVWSISPGSASYDPTTCKVSGR